ncbi:MAG TPA: hypothetical protein VLL52_12650, partial [Anaerolineae bacterium]|nr:hypothetical protein [Anaerolineae bacterium]
MISIRSHYRSLTILLTCLLSFTFILSTSATPTPTNVQPNQPDTTKLTSPLRQPTSIADPHPTSPLRPNPQSGTVYNGPTPPNIIHQPTNLPRHASFGFGPSSQTDNKTEFPSQTISTPSSQLSTNLSCASGTGTYGYCEWFAGGGATWAASEYDDISTTGTSISLTDDGSYELNLPFTFNFYGTNYTSIFVNANGIFTFGAAPTTPNSYTPHALPSATTPNNLIAGFWADLDPSAGGTIHYQHFYQSNSQFTIIQFTNVPHHASTTAKVSFQLKLYSHSGHFQLSYQRADSDGGNISIGYENAAGNYGRNNFFSTDNLTVPATIYHLEPTSTKSCTAYNFTQAIAYQTATPYADNIRTALTNANTNDNIGISGHCISRQDASTWPVYEAVQIIDKSLNIFGGYKPDFTVSDPALYPTTLNGLGLFQFALVQNGTFYLKDFDIIRHNALLSSAYNATNGGAIYKIGAGDIRLSNIDLRYNRANDGGAIYKTAGTLTTYNNRYAHITNNLARNNGGAIYNGDGNISLSASTSCCNQVSYNDAYNNGGGIYNSNGTIYLEETLAYNTAYNGGGVYNNGTLLLYANESIQHNDATNNGGGVYNTNITALGNNATIYNNTATNGGGIYHDSGTLYLDGGTLHFNTATAAGGGLYHRTGITNINDGADINDNDANTGGGLYLNLGIINFSDITQVYNNDALNGDGAGIVNFGTLNFYVGTHTIHYNDATNNGGGLYNTATINSYCSTNCIRIENNTANATTGLGGGLYTNNNLILDDDFDIDSNTAHDGGGVYLDSGTLTLAGATIHDNQALNAGHGGGLYNNSTIDIIATTTINNNHASGNGAGLYNDNTTTTCDGCLTFDTNIAATGNGGGLYHSSNATALTLNNATFQNNRADYGGALYNDATINSDSSSFTNNLADMQGAGIYTNDNGNTTLTRATISGNNASEQGGGIFTDTGTTNITDSTLSNNDATNNGGGIRNLYGITNITNSTLSGNTTDGTGGAIYIASGTINLTLTTLANNSSGIQNNSAVVNMNNSIIADSTSYDCRGALITQHHNLIEDTGTDACNITNGLNNSITGQDPALGPLTTNDGANTQTHALPPIS